METRLIKDIVNLERTQRRATKHLLNTNKLDYKSRLFSLQLLPLTCMHWLEMQDIMFLVKCLQQPTANPEIANLVSFSFSITRGGQTGNKPKVKLNKTTICGHFYTSRVVRLRNAFPVENLDLSKLFASTKSQVRKPLLLNYLQKFDPEKPAHFTLSARAVALFHRKLTSNRVTSLLL